MDYYTTLGVSNTASAEEIKRAYRKLALEHHPDRGGGEAEKFKQINEAYQVLSNVEKRARYDRFGAAGVGSTAQNQQGSPFGGGFRPEDFGDIGGFGGGIGDIFSDFFSQAFSTIQAEVQLSPSQAVLGDQLNLNIDGDTVQLNIPPGTQPGQQFVLRGKGGRHQRGRGDLIISARITIPNKLSKEEKRLWEQLKNLRP